MIPPGGEGKITLKVNTRGYQGNITKRANVYTNNPRGPNITLSLKAFVKVPIYVSTKYVYLGGQAGQSVTKTVMIRAETEKPLILEQKLFDLKNKVTYRLEEVEQGRLFRVHFTNVPGPAKTYVGFLKLKTNYPEKPEITIRIRGRFKEAS